MSRTAKKQQRKAPDSPEVKLIKNGLTKKEMAKAREQWLNHEGPYMNLAEALAYEAEPDKNHTQTDQSSSGIKAVIEAVDSAFVRVEANNEEVTNLPAPPRSNRKGKAQTAKETLQPEHH
ncbi:hypothetical protein GCM10023187_27310 [Nibrella viscosa]|uniref:Uncharacterized protein n=1 Tax=Nibrella viscosa TaxID=1084524 RepID=A0ABP8KIA1_9BACT